MNENSVFIISKDAFSHYKSDTQSLVPCCVPWISTRPVRCQAIQTDTSTSSVAHQSMPLISPIPKVITHVSHFSYKFTSAFGKILSSTMAVDDSFKKPGAVPFKWEIKPGVPRVQHQQQKCAAPLASQPQPPRLQPDNHHRLSELPSSPKLKPPPAGRYAFPSPVEPRTRSFRSTPRVRSDRFRFEQPLISRPDSVSTGCFFSPLIGRISSKRVIRRPMIEPEDDDDYTSGLETLARWSLSSRMSLSPFRGSPSPSSMSSYLSSPRPMGDAEWAGLGLF
ncbi:hypothetical protein L6164_030449 [Bauhinia variegata]|uniref:Uncharacterized protein n=1 Tax=Bauhinia variegata TaxID=167791 RepID=A0ACB9LCU5_BAUVA|nr:hypothetical protein L6164_030449 [Bauhinia variegata]